MTCKEQSAMGLTARVLLGVIWLCLPGILFGANGKVTGRVYDADTREPLPGANVVIDYILMDGKEVLLEAKPGAAADREGYYVILNVPPGTYNIRASMIGYRTLTQEHVRVNADRTITLDFALTATVLEQAAVEVVAQREVTKRSEPI